MLRCVEVKDENGFREKYAVDENGIKQGEYASYYPDGALSMRCSFQDGLVEGVCEIYHKNKQLYAKYVYHNGYFEGRYEQYYEDGKLAVLCHYKKGQLDGLCQLFSGDGRLSEQVVYRMGEKLTGKEAKTYLNQLQWLEFVSQTLKTGKMNEIS